MLFRSKHSHFPFQKRLSQKDLRKPLILIELYRVIEKKLVLPFGQRMFGCGTIVMNVKDVDTPVKEVKSIKAPRDVLAQLDKYININRDRYRVRGRDMVGGDGGHCHDHDDFDINDDII